MSMVHFRRMGRRCRFPKHLRRFAQPKVPAQFESPLFSHASVLLAKGGFGVILSASSGDGPGVPAGPRELREQHMGVKAIDLRKGMGVQYKDSIWVVFDFEKVSKGNWRSYMQITLKNVKTGQIIKDRFRVDEQLEPAMFDRRPMEFLYAEGDHFVLMDPASFEQVEMSKGLLGDDAVYLMPNIQLQVAFVEGQPISVELPFTVELKVVDTPPSIKGATATNQNKEALCEGGARVKVPAFIENGEVIKVDTRTGEYLGRA